MSNTILPLKAILEGNHQQLIKSLRDVAKHDGNTVLQSGSIDFSTLQETALKTTLNQHFSLRNTSLLNHFFNEQKNDWTIYQSKSPIPLYFSDQIVSALYDGQRCHDDILQPTYQLSLLLIFSIAQRTECITDIEHPIRRFSETLFLLIGKWEPAGGRPGKALPEKLYQLVSDINEMDIKSNDAWARLEEQLILIESSNQIRTNNLEKRLRESASINPDTQKLQQTVSRWINRKLNNKNLPESIILFIRLELISDLQYLVIQQGDKHPTWLYWQKLLHVLSWVFPKPDSESDLNKIKSVLMPFLAELDERYYDGIPSIEKYDSFLNELSDNLLFLIQGKTPKTAVYTAQQEELETAVIKQAIVKDYNEFCEGHWFLFKTEAGSTLRAKLILKAKKMDTLIFSNHLGKKVYESNFHDFSLLVASGNVNRINQDKPFKHALFKALKSLELFHRKSLKAKQQELNEREESINLAAQKARDEADQLQKEQETEKTKRDQNIKRRNEIEPAVIAQYSSTLQTLQVGAWLRFKFPDGTSMNNKLSVKLASTNRFIFTDRLGQPTGEKSLNELIDMMIDNTLEIISQGANFDNKLERIVKGLRKP